MRVRKAMTTPAVNEGTGTGTRWRKGAGRWAGGGDPRSEGESSRPVLAPFGRETETRRGPRGAAGGGVGHSVTTPNAQSPAPIAVRSRPVGAVSATASLARRYPIAACALLGL